MKILFENLIKNFEIAEIIRQPINDHTGAMVGYHSTVLDHKQQAIGGGTAETAEHALRIGVAEVAERYLFKSMTKADKLNYLVNEFPTTCGFAAGFNREKTRLRSICEGLERWIWSKWIDDGFFIQEVELPSLAGLSKHFASHFGKIYYFQKQFHPKLNEGVSIDLTFGAIVGIKDDGAFAGSRVCSVTENPWEHAFVEAWRNLNNYENFGSNTDQYRKGNAAAIRGYYFGSNS
jgi:hypothetical protein